MPCTVFSKIMISRPFLVLVVYHFVLPSAHGVLDHSLLQHVPPELKELYTESLNSNSFTCVDKEKTIAIDFLNDDYCDCKDGSDEYTGACSGSYFIVCIREFHLSPSLQVKFMMEFAIAAMEGMETV